MCHATHPSEMNRFIASELGSAPQKAKSGNTDWLHASSAPDENCFYVHTTPRKHQQDEVIKLMILQSLLTALSLSLRTNWKKDAKLIAMFLRVPVPSYEDDINAVYERK